MGPLSGERSFVSSSRRLALVVFAAFSFNARSKSQKPARLSSSLRNSSESRNEDASMMQGSMEPPPSNGESGNREREPTVSRETFPSQQHPLLPLPRDDCTLSRVV